MRSHLRLCWKIEFRNAQILRSLCSTDYGADDFDQFGWPLLGCFGRPWHPGEKDDSHCGLFGRRHLSHLLCLRPQLYDDDGCPCLQWLLPGSPEANMQRNRCRSNQWEPTWEGLWKSPRGFAVRHVRFWPHCRYLLYHALSCFCWIRSLFSMWVVSGPKVGSFFFPVSHQLSEVNMANQSYWLAGANRYLPGWRFLFAAAGVLSMTLALLLRFFLSEPPSVREIRDIRSEVIFWNQPKWHVLPLFYHAMKMNFSNCLWVQTSSNIFNDQPQVRRDGRWLKAAKTDPVSVALLVPSRWSLRVSSPLLDRTPSDTVKHWWDTPWKSVEWLRHVTKLWWISTSGHKYIALDSLDIQCNTLQCNAMQLLYHIISNFQLGYKL